MELALQILAVLAAVGGLAVASHWLRRANLGSNAGRRLAVEQRVNLSPGCQLVLVRWDNQEFLLSTGAQPCSLVSLPSNSAPPPAVAVPIRKDLRACAG
ncbi:MAG: hypothetical protein FJW30_02310 [Acidobacteria bacterium]|nr:hypothetical protein [Acidobacteriota bacterium]